MKKILGILILLLLNIMAVNAQTKTVKLMDIYAGPVWGGYCETTNLDNNATTQYVYLKFYENHDGTKPTVVIYLNDQTELDAFIKDMNSALDILGSKAAAKWSREEYAISVISSFSKLVLYQKPTEGTYYTFMKKSNVKKLIKKLKLIQLK